MGRSLNNMEPLIGRDIFPALHSVTEVVHRTRPVGSSMPLSLLCFKGRMEVNIVNVAIVALRKISYQCL